MKHLNSAVKMLAAAGDSAVDVELNRLDEEFEAYIHHENTKHDEAFEEAVALRHQMRCLLACL